MLVVTGPCWKSPAEVYAEAVGTTVERAEPRLFDSMRALLVELSRPDSFILELWSLHAALVRR